MERIKEAIRLAKERQSAAPADALRRSVPSAPAPGMENRNLPPSPEPPVSAVRLTSQHLERNRIVTQLPESFTSAPYEVLRTRLVQEMDQNGWNVLVITSPTPRCGKSVTAINLAISIARLPDREVVLLDLDLRKPSVFKYLGIDPRRELSAYLSGAIDIEDVAVPVETDKTAFAVIGSASPVKNPSEKISSPAMQDLVAHLRNLSERVIVVVDMPPILTADDVMAFLPLADCCLLTVAENITTRREIEACDDVLQSTHYLGCVLNMSSQLYENYY